LDCFSDVNTYAREYDKWRAEGDIFEFLRSDACPIPEHLRQMFFDLADQEEEIFGSIRNLPVVLCHKDFWVQNILCADGAIRIIDWDCAGWGYLGEDIASLVIDETPPQRIEAYYRALVPAYYRGLAEHMDVSGIQNRCIREMILIKFGYRLVRGYRHVKTAEAKQRHIAALQKIYEMESSYANH
jgi:thiamine kinase-like enzyme